MTKTIYKRYHYNECDDFAAFLEEMASDGWKFEKWGAGLVFRKTEPQKIQYVVDVFPKAWNQDTRPAPNTLEFAEYCQAAGWKLIDGKSKFCIFKQIRQDAQPIVTARERFVNVAKAEGRTAITNLICSFVVAAIWVISFFTTDFPDSMFSNYNLLILLFWSAWFIYSLIRLVSFFIWKRKTAKKLRNGSAIWYGNYRRVHSVNRWILSIVTLAIWVMVLLSSGMEDLIPGVVIASVIAILVLWLIDVGRPSRGTYTGIVILLISSILVLGTVVGILSSFQSDTGSDISDYPLLPSDYTSVKVTDITDSDLLQRKSIFGSEIYAYIWYDEGAGEKDLDYKFYKTFVPWLLNICYSSLKKAESDRLTFKAPLIKSGMSLFNQRFLRKNGEFLWQEKHYRHLQNPCIMYCYPYCRNGAA